MKSKPVDFWVDGGQLYGKVPIALSKTFNTEPRPGWIRATQAMSPEAGNEIARLSQENAMLREQLKSNAVPALLPDVKPKFSFTWLQDQPNQPDSYYLRAIFKNEGNAYCKRLIVNVLIRKPDDTEREPVAPFYGYDLGIGPGLKVEHKKKVAEDTVNKPGDKVLYFSIHQDQGFAKYGEIPLSDITIENRKPE